MEEMIFLYALAAIVTVIAIIQDLKEREVANWLNFSFIGVAFAYRAFYASIFESWNFLLYGLLGFALMFVLAYILYYGRAFAGGDAKLLMGFGIVLPYTSVKSVLILGIGFVFLVFLAGFVWSLLYSIYFVGKNKKKFKENWNENWRKYRLFVLLALLFFVGSFILGDLGKYLGVLIFLVSLLWIYVKSLDKTMIMEKRWKDLREGDWLEKDVKIKNRWIKGTVHGLSLSEIERIRKSGKRVLIKEGIPFTPAFLGALFVMVFFLEALLSYLEFLI